MSERQNRIVWIKQKEKSGFTFVEIVNNYNATFGTNYFPELFGGDIIPANQNLPALEGEGGGRRRRGKEFAENLQDIFFGEGGLFG
jgi:hypothetical protein